MEIGVLVVVPVPLFAQSEFQANQDSVPVCSQRGEINAKEAIQWIKKAAMQNYPEAQCALGYCYVKGLGVEKNRKKAIQWIKKAAEQNVPEAQAILAGCYELGRGVQKDVAQAIRWYRLAVKNGVPQAKKALQRLKAN